MTAADLHPVERLWRAAGKPSPIEVDGTPITPRGIESGVCAVTGSPGSYLYEQGFSANFLPPRAAGVAFRFAATSTVRSKAWAQPQKCLSPAAVWAAKTVLLRAATWIQEPDGEVEFWPYYRCPKDEARAALWREFWGARDPSKWLEWLLRPRPAGTIAGMPLYGIDHGGEANAARCFWPGRPRPADPLIKLQAKHVAPYVQPSTATGRLALYVDGEQVHDIACATWLRAAATIAKAVRHIDLPGPVIRRGLAARAFEPTTQAVFHTHLIRLLAQLGDLPSHPFWPTFVGALHV